MCFCVNCRQMIEGDHSVLKFASLHFCSSTFSRRAGVMQSPEQSFAWNTLLFKTVTATSGFLRLFSASEDLKIVEGFVCAWISLLRSPAGVKSFTLSTSQEFLPDSCVDVFGIQMKTISLCILTRNVIAQRFSDSGPEMPLNQLQI